jgi:hypothetical protein
MSPLTAAATRTALADNQLNPETPPFVGRRIVHLYLKAKQGKTIPMNVNTAGVRAALRELYGAGFVSALTGGSVDRQDLELLVVSADRASEYGSGFSASNLVSNGVPVTDNDGWTQHGGGTTTFARSTAETLIGPASILIDTDGLAANQGAYLLSPASPASALTKAESHRASCWILDSAGSGAVRLFIEERNAADSSQVGKSNSTNVTPSATWQQATVARTCAAGNRIRVGVETSGTSDRAHFVVGVNVALVRDLLGADLTSDMTAHLVLVFDGVQFVPELLYDALDANLAGTLSTDKDQLSHDVIQLTLS